MRGNRVARSRVTAVACASAVVAASVLISTAVARSSFTVAVAPVLPSAIMGTLYPPKPIKAVGFCRPVLKFGRACTGYTFTVGKGGSLPAGMSIDKASGAVVGLPRAHADTYQPKGSTAPGLYHFAVCSHSQKGTKCKKTQLAVFSALGGTWKGSFEGDPGAFTCNTPLAGDITLSLTQKVSVSKGTPISTVGGTATLTNLPPISADGSQNGPCTTSDQKFGLGPGLVKNPDVGGSNSTKGVWNVALQPNGSLSGTVTIQDSGANGFFSQISFTASK